MASRKNQIRTVQALIAGNRYLHRSTTSLSLIDGEFNEFLKVDSVKLNKRKWLLQIFHLTRAFDSTLKVYITKRGWRSNRRSLGSYLFTLKNRNVITEAERNHWQTTIVKPRNKYMHEAGSWPHNDRESNQLLAEIIACLSKIP